MADNQLKFLVPEELEGQRADKGISEYLDDFSRSRIHSIIKEGRVFVNGKNAEADLRLKTLDEVVIDVPDIVIPDILPEDIPLDILYEDEELLVVNKPKGMVVHPAAGHYSGTLVNALMYHCTDLSGINGVLRPGIVHRIDRDTTGALIVCKTDEAHRNIAAQLKEHSIKRLYRAVVTGVIKDDEGTVDAPIGRHPSDRKKMAANVPNGKRAVTHYRVLERFKAHTYIECRLETGRTHQIRVHMALIHHPVLGDEVYSAAKSRYRTSGQTLHAYLSGFDKPSDGSYIEVTAPLPDYFEDLLKKLRNEK
ncbi:MAG: RluA family pseudouridine synthase [Lachnospiraceae bacterium]|nr:RluA family pseudouridine synthase [Lachnospiraceae bacterium]